MTKNMLQTVLGLFSILCLKTFVCIILTSLFNICNLSWNRNLLSVKRNTKPYSYDKQLEIFHTHYHTDIITHDTAFDEPVCGTIWRKLVIRRYPVNCQSERNRPGANHQSSDHWYMRASVAPHPRLFLITPICICQQWEVRGFLYIVTLPEVTGNDNPRPQLSGVAWEKSDILTVFLKDFRTVVFFYLPQVWHFLAVQFIYNSGHSVNWYGFV